MTEITMNSKYLVSLDAILDTRLGTLAVYDQALAAEVIADPKYANRVRDDFFLNRADFSKARWDQLWDNRSKEVLAASTPTHFLADLAALMRLDKVDPNCNYETRKIRLDINIYPYRFDQDEIKDLTEVILPEYIPGDFIFNVIRISEEQMSPAYLKNNNYTTVVIYELRKWLEIQENNFKEVFIPNISVIAPELMHYDIDLSKLSAEQRQIAEKMNPFRALELNLSLIMVLRLRPAIIFSSAFIPLPKSGK